MNYVNDFIKYIEVEKNYSDHTIISYREDLVEFFKYLDGKDVKKTDYKFIRTYLAYMFSKKYEKKTILRQVGIFPLPDRYRLR